MMVLRMILEGQDKTTSTKYKNPPIVEAIIGVAVPELPEVVIESFRGAASLLASLGFAVQRPIFQGNFSGEIDAGKHSFEKHEAGLQFLRSDSAFAVQFLRTGFVFSQLGNYSSWENFTEPARQIWEVYQSVIGATEFASFQIRYINKLFIPEMKQWEEYIRIYPFLPPDVPQMVTEYFSRIVMPIEEPPGRLTHQQAILPQEREGHLTMLFDNDFQFSALGLSASSLWTRIEDVRSIKDGYFDKFLTPLMKETFDA